MEHKWKKSSPELAGLLEASLAGIVCEKKAMFGSPVYMVNRNMFTGVHEDNIYIRLSEAQRKQIVKDYAGARPFEPLKGRVMREYINIPAALYRDKAAFRDWLLRSHAFVSSLPAKPAKKGSQP